MPWDYSAAVKHARDNAESTSISRCAQYTREAIEAGGVTLTRNNSAKDYGSSLTAVGFNEFPFRKAPYVVGDVAIFQGFTGHPHGHMQIFDGKNWISDFIQNDFYPGTAYRTNKPAFSIYKMSLGNVVMPDDSIF